MLYSAFDKTTILREISQFAENQANGLYIFHKSDKNQSASVCSIDSLAARICSWEAVRNC